MNRGDTLIAITPSYDMDWIRAARELRRRGTRIVAVVADMTSFGVRGDTRAATLELAASGILTYVLREGEDMREALSQRQQTADDRQQMTDNR